MEKKLIKSSFLILYGKKKISDFENRLNRKFELSKENVEFRKDIIDFIPEGHKLVESLKDRINCYGIENIPKGLYGYYICLKNGPMEGVEDMVMIYGDTFPERFKSKNKISIFF